MGFLAVELPSGICQLAGKTVAYQPGKPLECADVAIGLVRDRQNAASEMYVELVKSRRSGPMLTAMRFEPETQRVVDYDAEQRLVACEELVRARR